MKSRILLAVIAVSLIAATCELDVPISEMVKAKNQIEDAKRAKADKYDPENLSAAEKNLIKSHEFMEKEDTDKARASANEAYRLAKISSDKSWPLYSREIIDSAKMIIAEADDLNAESAAPEEFNKAKASIAEADSLHAAGSFPQSLAEGKNAEASASAAKLAAGANIPAMKARIAELKRAIETVGSGLGGDSSSGQLTTAAGELERADALLDSGKVKDAIPLMASAEGKISQAKRDADRTNLKGRIDALKKESAALKGIKGSEYAKEDIAAADIKIAEAESSIEDTDKAAKNTDEASLYLSNASVSIKKGQAEERLDSVKKLSERLKGRDTAKTAAAGINEADIVIAESGDLFKAGKFDDSIEKSDMAESILSGISVALDREAAAKPADKSPLDTEAAVHDEMPALKVYVVKYRKKNTDCLWRIAQREYNDPKMWPMIYMANKDQIKDPDLIFPGQKFVIPPLKQKNTKEEIKSGDGDKSDDKQSPSEKTDDDAK